MGSWVQKPHHADCPPPPPSIMRPQGALEYWSQKSASGVLEGVACTVLVYVYCGGVSTTLFYFLLSYFCMLLCHCLSHNTCYLLYFHSACLCPGSPLTHVFYNQHK